MREWLAHISFPKLSTAFAFAASSGTSDSEGPASKSGNGLSHYRFLSSRA